MKVATTLFSLFFCIFLSASPPAYFLIIHGTWSPPFDWHMPGGDFYDALSSVSASGTVSFFLWSGKNNHAARVAAGKQLVEYIRLHYPTDARLNLIGHSHGSNVGILASQEMAQDPQNEHQIHGFYALGTPTDIPRYMPDMTTITYFYNFFSFNDFIQPIFGFFGREYPSHDRISNICITINGEAPIHTNLHHPLIANWLPAIHENLAALKLAGFELFDFKKPAIIHFSEKTIPRYEVDISRMKKLKRDKRIVRSLKMIHLEA